MIDDHFYRVADHLRAIGALPDEGGQFSKAHLRERFAASATAPYDSDSILAFLKQIDLLAK